MLFTLISFILTLLAADCAGGIQGVATEVEKSFGNIRGWMQTDFRTTAISTEGDIGDGSVCVVLRHHGDLLGYGTASNLDDAANIAFSNVRKHHIFSMGLPESLRKEIIDSISIELEFGNPPVPSPHKIINRFEQTFNKGMDGVAVRRGTEWDLRLPAELRLSPYRPVSNIVESLCINLGVHPTIVFSHELPSEEDVTVYSIPVTTYIQENSTSIITKLIRGDEFVAESGVGTGHLYELAELLASHLMKSTGENGMMIGGYQPETDTLTSMFATHFVQSLSADALLQYAELSNDNSASVTASSILNSIANDVELKGSLDDETAAAIVVMLYQTKQPFDENIQLLLDVCTKRVIALVQELSSSKDAEKHPLLLSLLTAATVEIWEKSGNEQLQQLGVELCLRCLNDVPLKLRVSIIPWIIEPALKLQRQQFIDSEDSLEELVRIAVATQIQTNKDFDLIGGFSLSSEDGNVVDARGLRMIPMLAMMSRSSTTQKTTAFQSLISAVRFVEQLTTRNARAERFGNPPMALGGVRESPWNAAMPTEATAMALLGITKTIKTLDEIQSSLK